MKARQQADPPREDSQRKPLLPGFYTRFFVRKIGYISFVPKSVVRPCVCRSVSPSVTFLVIVSSPKPLDVATSNFIGA